jgi:hypothetical protein
MSDFTHQRETVRSSGGDGWPEYRVSFDYGIAAGPLVAVVRARNIAEAPLRVAGQIFAGELAWPPPGRVKKIEVTVTP